MNILDLFRRSNRFLNKNIRIHLRTDGEFSVCIDCKLKSVSVEGFIFNRKCIYEVEELVNAKTVYIYRDSIIYIEPLREDIECLKEDNIVHVKSWFYKA